MHDSLQILYRVWWTKNELAYLYPKCIPDLEFAKRSNKAYIPMGYTDRQYALRIYAADVYSQYPLRMRT